MKNYERVCATVDLDAIIHNVKNMESIISPNTKIMGVIKTDGYGHGAVSIAKELEPLDCIYGFAVATVEEGAILKKSGVTKPILILGYTFPYSYEEIVKLDIRPTVFRYDTAKEFSDIAVKEGKNVRVHVKVDTGMARIGVQPDNEGLQFIREILELPGIEVEGIFTHFAKADEFDKAFTLNQLQIFKQFVARVEKELQIQIPIKHCSNSAGIIDYKEANMDVVRAGITLYGLWPSNEISRDIIDLQAALTLTSHVVFVKELEEGKIISYNGTFITKRKTKVATIPLGYGDGYPRGLSNKGYVLIHGKKAPILGRICMDQFMVDVTDIEHTKEGDLVTLIGRDGDEVITMEETGELADRFNYELACDLGKRIPRLYKKNGKTIGSKDYFDDYE